MLTREKIEDVADVLNYRVYFITQPGYGGKPEHYVEFEGWSPAGENILWIEFYDTLDQIPDKLTERYADFDPEEHAAGWYHSGSGEPSSLRELLDDAHAQEDMLAELIRFLRDAAA